MAGKLVCVTGASGFIASWLVKLLLERDYTVRATVRDTGAASKTKHLLSLPGANERLHLVKADLLVEGSFDAAVDGCSGVFHTASPFFYKAADPQKELLEPAVNGTLNVLGAAVKAKSVRRVVLTSSLAAINNSRERKTAVDESDWTDPEYVRSIRAWYPLSKTLAEQAAWDFAKTNNLDLVVINPSMVVGALLQPTLNTSSEYIVRFLQGSEKYPNLAFGFVHVRDVALAHILAYENQNASGRYIVSKECLHLGEFVELLQKLFPEFEGVATPALPEEPRVTKVVASTEKARKELGLELKSVEDAVKESVASLKESNILAPEVNLLQAEVLRVEQGFAERAKN